MRYPATVYAHSLEKVPSHLKLSTARLQILTTLEQCLLSNASFPLKAKSSGTALTPMILEKLTRQSRKR